MPDLVSLILLLITAGAAVDKAASIIVYGKIFLPIRNYVSKRAYPDDVPEFNLRFLQFGPVSILFEIVKSAIKYYSWRAWLIVSTMLKCTECTGVWVAGVTVYLSRISSIYQMSDSRIVDFLFKTGVIAFCASLFEVLRVGRVIAIDLKHELKSEPGAGCLTQSTDSTSEMPND